MPTSVKWNGKEVQTPWRRKLVVVIVVLWSLIAMPIAILLLVVMVPVMIVLHPFFRLFRRRGTLRGSSIVLDRRSFDKVNW